MSTLVVPGNRDPKTVELARFLDIKPGLPADARQTATVILRAAQQMITTLKDGENLWEGLKLLTEARDAFVLQSLSDGEALRGPRT
jgi:hypothetical protein